jgi:hypothetical protein
MDAKRAKQLAIESVSNQILEIEILIKGQAEQGLLSCTKPFLLPAVSIYFKEEGYNIKSMQIGEYIVFEISWE